MRWWTCVAAVGVGVAMAAPSAQAAVFDVQINSALVGTARQDDVPAADGPSGVNSCTPTATANAFAYLQARYPDVYGTSLVGSGSVADVTAVAALLATNPYMRTSSTSGTAIDRWVAAISKYPQTVAPGTTELGGMGNWVIDTEIYPWHVNATTSFNFLYDALVHESGVEIGMTSFVGGPGHTLTLTGLHWDDANDDGIIGFNEGATMTFVDPLDGLVHTSRIGQTSAGSFIHTDYYLAGKDSGAITMGSWERPVAAPEAGSLAMLAVGTLGLMRRRRRGI